MNFDIATVVHSQNVKHLSIVIRCHALIRWRQCSERYFLSAVLLEDLNSQSKSVRMYSDSGV